MKKEAFWKGFEAKRQEIQEMGFAAARDKHNLETPPGTKWQGTPEGLHFVMGEVEALMREVK